MNRAEPPQGAGMVSYQGLPVGPASRKAVWVVDHRRTFGVVWCGRWGAGSRLRRRRGETRAFSCP